MTFSGKDGLWRGTGHVKRVSLRNLIAIETICVAIATVQENPIQVVTAPLAGGVWGALLLPLAKSPRGHVEGVVMRTLHPVRAAVMARSIEAERFGTISAQRTEHLACFLRVSIAGLVVAIATMAYAAFV